MADGDHGASYQDVRDKAHLSADDVPDSIIEKNLDSALDEIKRILKTNISSSQPSFTDTLFNSRDFMDGERGSILYVSQFEDYLPLVSITSIAYKTSTDGSYTTLSEGMEYDYLVDKRKGCIKFTFYLVADGFENVKISGTYGYATADIPTWIEQWITLLAAIKSMVYASQGSYQDVYNFNIGNVSVSQGQYSPNFQQNFNSLKEELYNHMKSHGVKAERTSFKSF